MKIKKFIIIIFLIIVMICLITNHTVEYFNYVTAVDDYKTNINTNFIERVRKIFSSEKVNTIKDITNMEQTCNKLSSAECLGNQNCGLYIKKGDHKKYFNGSCVLDNSSNISDIKPYFMFENNNPKLGFPHYDMAQGTYTNDGINYNTYSNDDSMLNNIRLSGFNIRSTKLASIPLISNLIVNNNFPNLFGKLNITYNLEQNLSTNYYNKHQDEIVPVLISVDGGEIDIDNYEIISKDNSLIINVKGIPVSEKQNHNFNLNLFKQFGSKLDTSKLVHMTI